MFYSFAGETLLGGIQNVFLLQDDEALILAAVDEFVDKTGGGKKYCSHY